MAAFLFKISRKEKWMKSYTYMFGGCGALHIGIDSPDTYDGSYTFTLLHRYAGSFLSAYCLSREEMLFPAAAFTDVGCEK